MPSQTNENLSYDRPVSSPTLTAAYENAVKAVGDRQKRKISEKKELDEIKKNLAEIHEAAKKFQQVVPTSKGPGQFFTDVQTALNNDATNLTELKEQVATRLKAQEAIYQKAEESKNPGFFSRCCTDAMDKLKGLNWDKVKGYLPLIFRIVGTGIVGVKKLFDYLNAPRPKGGEIAPKKLKEIMTEAENANKVGLEKPAPSTPPPPTPVVPPPSSARRRPPPT